MSKDYQRLWKDVTSATDEAKAVRTLAEILVDKEGRAFASRLERKEAELCIEILDRVSRDFHLPSFRRLRCFRQGIAEHNLDRNQKHVFFVTLRRLAGTHGRLPDSMTITEKIEVSDKILASGGFADVRCGTYMGRLVAVKTTRVQEQDDLFKIRKVSIDDGFSDTWNVVSTVLLQQFCKEVILWKMLSHPNVLKLAGAQGDMEKG